MTNLAVSAEARLRAKSQLTLPETIVAASGISEGDRFLIEIIPEEPDTIRLHRIRPSYAGALRGVYGNIDDYVAEERATWDRG